MNRINFFKSLFGIIGGLFGAKTLSAAPTEDPTEVMIQIIMSSGNPGSYTAYLVGKAKVKKTQEWWYDVELIEIPSESVCRVVPQKEDKNKWI